MKALLLIFLLATTAVTPVHAGWFSDAFNWVVETTVTVVKAVHTGYKYLENKVDDFLGGTAKKFIHLKGRMVCASKPYPDASVHLMEKDTFWDDNYGKSNTDRNGRYELKENKMLDGLWNENEPYIRVFHRCNVKGVENCYLSFEKPVPVKALAKSAEKLLEYDMGTIELLNPRPSDEQGCVKP